MAATAPSPNDVISDPVTVEFRKYTLEEDTLQVSRNVFRQLVIGYWPSLSEEKIWMGVPETDDTIQDVGGLEGDWLSNSEISHMDWNLIQQIRPPDKYRNGCGEEIQKEQQLSWIKWLLQEADRIFYRGVLPRENLFMTYKGYLPTCTEEYDIEYVA